MKIIYIIKILLLLSLVGLINCSDSNNLNEKNNAFDYNYPEDCCSSLGWSTIMGEHEIGVRLFYPNIFTPNSNSENSIFYIHTNMLIDNITSTNIYSQEGNLVFENLNFEPNNPDQGWNGMVNGEFIEGVYKVIIEFQNPNGTNVKEEITICSIECHQDLIFHYSEQGLNFDNCRWINQSDGEGSFDESIPVNECQ